MSTFRSKQDLARQAESDLFFLLNVTTGATNELLKSYIHRLTKAIERGWPDPDYNNAYRENKGIEFFVRGLTPPGLKQKAHQYLIENPANTYEQLRNHISTKDLSFAVSSEFTGNSSSSIDNRWIEGSDT